MNRTIKMNLSVIGIMLMFGLISNLLVNFFYIEKRLFAIVISILEIIIVIVIAKKQNMTMKEIGLCKPIRPIAWIVGLIFSFMPMCLMIVLNGGNMRIMFPQKKALLMCILQTLYYFIVVAPSEEIIFRGFILENFSKSFSERISILFTSFLFAIIHIYSGSVVNLLMAFLISVIYCKIKWIKNNHSLYPCMIGHAINDSMNEWLPYFLF